MGRRLEEARQREVVLREEIAGLPKRWVRRRLSWGKPNSALSSPARPKLPRKGGWRPPSQTRQIAQSRAQLEQTITRLTADRGNVAEEIRAVDSSSSKRGRPKPQPSGRCEPAD